MRAAVYEGIERIVVKDIPIPKINDEEILVRIKCCAICGTDIRIYHYGNPSVIPPTTTGHELSGVIEKIGKEVKDFKEGERVTIATSIPCLKCPLCQRGLYNICDNLKGIGYKYPGGFAEYMRVPEQALKAGYLLRIPENLSFEEASISEPFACVINGQELSNIKEGDTIVVIGSGPIGCMHVSLARISGAEKIILCDLSQMRLDLAKKGSIPADYFINTKEDDIKKAVMKITKNRGADVVIVAAPSARAQEDGLSVVAKRGRLNLFGGLPKKDPIAKFMSNLIHYKEIFVHGSYGSTARQHKRALELFSKGEIEAKKFISLTLPLEKILDGLRITEEKRVHRVVIRI